jgi:hypothetical protein
VSDQNHKYFKGGGVLPVKDVYFPDKISESDYNAAAKRAANVAWQLEDKHGGPGAFFNTPNPDRRGVVVTDPQTSIKFRVYFDFIDGTPGVANAHISP